MSWKATGRPTVRQQRGRWVVRVDGIHTETGKHRPHQLGTYSSQRAASKAAAKAIEQGQQRVDRDTLGALVDQWVESRTDVGRNQQIQYRWAATHITAGLGAIALHSLDREDIARWLNGLARDGKLSRRSIQIIRMTLRAALTAAVEAGELRRNPAAQVSMPREIARKPRPKETDAWDDKQLDRFLTTVQSHRWGGPIRLETLYGLRKSELLAIHWSDIDLKRRLVTIDTGLVEADGQLVWSDGKNPRSRRTIPIDADTARTLLEHRKVQQLERQAAAEFWRDNDLLVATHTGGPVRPRNYSRTLDRLVARAKVPRLTSHGLRHTAATHMVASASDLGEVRAAAEILGHSPEMLMKTYAYALPASIRAVTTKIGKRSARTARE
jgi:integrase